MTKSNYYNDKRKEECFGEWLDDNFYSRYEQYYDAIKRNTDKELQKKGVDVIVIKNGKTIYVDEKATLDYINQNIPTFAFEILNTTSGKQGWLFDEDYITTYYLLAWPYAKDVSIPDESTFKNTPVMSIKREDVIKLLANRNITKENINDYINQVRNSHQNRFDICEGISLNFNHSKKEQPINLVIRRDLLEEYTDYYYLITHMPNPLISLKKSKK